MGNIVLTGFMGTGKTTVGEMLAKKLDMKLIDMDMEIEKEEGMKITVIFERFGEPGFRDRETAMARKLSTVNNAVISTGGGVVLRDDNMTYLRKNGIIFCLMAMPETILNRTKNNADRPLLNVPNPLKKITDMLQYRTPFYLKADVVIHTDDMTPEDIAGKIIGMAAGGKPGKEGKVCEGDDCK